MAVFGFVDFYFVFAFVCGYVSAWDIVGPQGSCFFFPSGVRKIQHMLDLCHHLLYCSKINACNIKFPIGTIFTCTILWHYVY